MSEKITKYLTPIVALFFATALGVTASSTIGTDISTGGNLTVSGNATVTGATVLNTLAASTTAAGSDITLYAADDLYFTSEDDFTLDTEGTVNLYSGVNTGGGYYSQIYENGNEAGIVATDGSRTTSAYFNSGGLDLQVASDVYMAFQVGSPGNELYITNGAVKVTNKLQLSGNATPPVACAAGEKGSIYYDSDINELCLCNGTNWLQIDDMATTCS